MGRLKVCLACLRWGTFLDRLDNGQGRRVVAARQDQGDGSPPVALKPVTQTMKPALRGWTSRARPIHNGWQGAAERRLRHCLPGKLTDLAKTPGTQGQTLVTEYSIIRRESSPFRGRLSSIPSPSGLMTLGGIASGPVIWCGRWRYHRCRRMQSADDRGALAVLVPWSLWLPLIVANHGSLSTPCKGCLTA